MSTPEKDFETSLTQFLEGFPATITLPQSQYLYSKVIVGIGLKILNRFQDDLIEPHSLFTRGGGQGGGGGGGAAGPHPGGAGVVGAPIIQPDTKGGGSGAGGRPSCIILAGLALGLRDYADQNVGNKST